MADKELTMDRAYRRLCDLITVQRFVLKNWTALTAPQELIDLTTQELANICTPGSPEAWRTLAERNGVHVPDGLSRNHSFAAT